MGIEDPAPPGAFEFRDGRIALEIDLRVYRLAAVQKAAYRLAREATVVLGEMRGDALGVALTFAPDTTECVALAGARHFFRELLDQELREKIRDETASLRTLLLAAAFARTDLAPRS
jgi:His-Xaa-Ser system protein HxsD